jgi:folate-binding protein YgfZ
MKTVIVDQSAHGMLRVTGEDRRRFLQGMLTNDVATLVPGGFLRAAVLNVKGRVLAVVDAVLDGDDAYLLVTEPVTAAKLHQLLERHAIADDVEFEPVSRPLHRVWGSPAEVWTAPPIFAAPEAASPEAEVEIRRVEAGLPRYGVDVSEDHFPFEANLDSAISMTKGCYIGQEVVARASARGHANKRLRGVRLSGEDPVAPGTPVSSAAREAAGAVTSSVVSPDLGPIALAYVHKSSWDAGTKVTLAGREGVVTDLPFTPA